MEFDEDRRLIRKSYPAGMSFENVFDDAGQLVAKRDGLGFETRAADDGNGNLTSLVDPEGRRDAWVFDDYGNRLIHFEDSEVFAPPFSAMINPASGKSFSNAFLSGLIIYDEVSGTRRGVWLCACAATGRRMGGITVTLY